MLWHVHQKKFKSFSLSLTSTSFLSLKVNISTSWISHSCWTIALSKLTCLLLSKTTEWQWLEPGKATDPFFWASITKVDQAHVSRVVAVFWRVIQLAQACWRGCLILSPSPQLLFVSLLSLICQHHVLLSLSTDNLWTFCEIKTHLTFSFSFFYFPLSKSSTCTVFTKAKWFLSFRN